MPIAYNKTLKKHFNYSNEDIVAGVNTGVLSLDKSVDYNFRDDKGEFSLKGLEAEELLLSKKEGVYLYDPADVTIQPNMSDVILGTALQGLEGLTLGASDVLLTQGMGVNKDQLDFIKDSSGAFGTVADIAGSVVSPVNKIGLVAKSLAPASKIITREAIEGSILGGVHSLGRSLSDKISHDKDVTTDILYNAAINTALGGAVGASVGGVMSAGKQISKFTDWTTKKLGGKKTNITQRKIDLTTSNKTVVAPSGEKLGIVLKKNPEGHWTHQNLDKELFFKGSFSDIVKTLDLDNPKILNEFGEKVSSGNVSDLADSFYGATVNLKQAYKKQLKDSLDGKYAKEAEVIKEAYKDSVEEGQKLIAKNNILKKNEYDNYLKRFDEEINTYDAQKYGDQLTVYNIVDTFKNKKVMSETFLGDIEVHLNSIFEEAGLTLENFKGSKSQLSLVNDTLEEVWREYRPTGFFERVNALKDFPSKLNFVLKKALDDNIFKSQKMMADDVIPILRQKGHKINVSPDVLINKLKAKWLPNLLDQNGNPIPSTLDIYQQFNKFIGKLAQYGKYDVAVDGTKKWKSIDINTLNKWADSFSSSQGGGKIVSQLAQDFSNIAYVERSKAIMDYIKKNKIVPKEKIAEFKKYQDKIEAIKLATQAVAGVYKKGSDNFLKDLLTKNVMSKAVGGVFFGPTGILAGEIVPRYLNLYGESVKEAALGLVKKTGKATKKITALPIEKRSTKYIPLIVSAQDNDAVNRDENYLAEMSQSNNDFELIKDQPYAQYDEAGDVIKRLVNTRNSLTKIIPKHINSVDPFSKPVIDERQERSYLKYRSAVLNPSLSIDRIGEGIASYEEVDAIKDNYPGLHRLLMEGLIENSEKIKNLPDNKKDLIKYILGVDSGNIIGYQVKQMAMSSKNSQAMQKERLRKMNLNAQMNSMSKASSLEQKNIE
jgi:hypothetical protein